MTVTTYPEKHIVVFPMQMWGHSRTMCTLVARFVKLRPVTVTFFVAVGFYDRVKAEIERDFLPEEGHLMSRIRPGLIALEENKEVHNSDDAEAAFEASWIKIINKQPLTCAKIGARFEPHPVPPQAVVLDLFLNRAFEAVKKLSGGTIKIFNWWPASTQGFPVMSQDVEPLVHEEAARRGVSFEVAAYDMMVKPANRVLEIPSLPPMYDYENHPQAFPFPPEFPARKLVKAGGMVQRSAGIITFDAAEYSPVSTSIIRGTLAETGRKAYFAGPLIPRVQEDTSSDPRSDKILKFLDEKLAAYGERSVIYISFGSLFWPTDPAKLWAVLDVIIEKNIPFVMSAAATFSLKPPAEIQDKISEYGNAIVADWVPQQALLDHPATGWYLMHGGHNSTLESIMSGIPMIVWPIDADQPMNAIHLTENLNLAYELIEVRSGTGAGKIYRNGRTPIGTIDAVKAEMRNVLALAYGEDGLKKRANLLNVRETLRAAWTEDGIARREVEAFVDDL